MVKGMAIAITPPLLVLWGLTVAEYGFMEGTMGFGLALVSTATIVTWVWICLETWDK